MLTSDDIIEIKAQIAKRFDRTPAQQAAESFEQMGLTSKDLDDLLNLDGTPSELSERLSITIDELIDIEREEDGQA